MTPEEAWACLRDATAGLPGGWTTARYGPARVFTMATNIAAPVEFELYYYGPPNVFSSSGGFDPAAVTRGDPFIVATVAPSGQGQRLADLGRGLGVNPTLVPLGDADLVVAASPGVAQEDVEAFVAFVAGSAS